MSAPCLVCVAFRLRHVAAALLPPRWLVAILDIACDSTWQLSSRFHGTFLQWRVLNMAHSDSMSPSSPGNCEKFFQWIGVEESREHTINIYILKNIYNMVETGQICLNLLIDRMRCPSSAVKRLLKLTPKISYFCYFCGSWWFNVLLTHFILVFNILEMSQSHLQYMSTHRFWRTDLPMDFHHRLSGGNWINNIVNGIRSWRAVTVVELRNRSDTGQANRSPQTTILPALR